MAGLFDSGLEDAYQCFLLSITEQAFRVTSGEKSLGVGSVCGTHAARFFQRSSQHLQACRAYHCTRR